MAGRATPGASCTASSGSPTPPVRMFRRLELNTHPAAFWGELITSAGGSNGKKAVMQLKRAEIPADVTARGSPAELDAAAADAARRSVTAFMDFVDTLSSSRAAAHREKILMLEMKHVGLKCEGRSGPYDLMYFPHRDVIYAAHSYDDAIVYVMA